MEVKCVVCDKVFEKSEGRLKRTKTGKHYCSKECYASSPIITQEKTGKEIECSYCGSVVYRTGYVIEHSKSGNFFCSKKCSGAHLRKHEEHNIICSNCGISFRKSPSSIKETNYCSRDCWKEGIKSTGVAAYRKHKGDTCELCGFVPVDPCQLDVHHSDQDSNNHTKGNLKTLCANCHRLLHKQTRDSEGGGQCEL